LTYLFKGKYKKIISVKAALTIIKTKEGIRVALEDLTIFIQTTSFSTVDAISILDRQIDYLQELGYMPEEILKIVQNTLDKQNSGTLVNFGSQLAKLLGSISFEIGYRFIEENIPEARKVIEKIELLFRNQPQLLNSHLYEEAFSSLRQINNLLSGTISNQISITQWFSYQAKMYMGMSKIGELENRADVYLNYLVYGLVFESARSLTNLPYIHEYFWTLEHYKNRTGYLNDDDFFISSCMQFFGSRDKVYDLLYTIMKNKLFPIFGFDQELCNKENLKNLDIIDILKIQASIKERNYLEISYRIISEIKSHFS